jgi:hypothetical protein
MREWLNAFTIDLAIYAAVTMTCSDKVHRIMGIKLFFNYAVKLQVSDPKL